MDNIEPGAVAEIADCTNPPIARQKWSFDPEQGTIRSSFNTVLDVLNGNLAAGAAVRLATYNNTNAQRWYADRASTDCSNVCYPACSSACAGAGPGTGACIGSCMGSCVGSCMAGP